MKTVYSLRTFPGLVAMSAVRLQDGRNGALPV